MARTKIGYACLKWTNELWKLGKSNPDLEIEMGPNRSNNQGEAPEETSPAEKTLTAARLVWKQRMQVEQNTAALLSSLKMV
jgi:type IV secretory pathway VirB4 component